MHRLTVSLLLIACAGQLCAADTKPALPPPTPSDDDSNWTLQLNASRKDIFYDEVQRLQLERTSGVNQGTEIKNPDMAENGISPIEDARAVILQCDKLLNERKWADGEKLCETAIRRLAPAAADKDVAQYLQNIQGYKIQFQDARERDEAEAAFDAQHLVVEGILWAETGPRLAIISGEPRALGINDRVKDCVIINIDTDRVDFRFHYKRKRFEFPRYVGEETKNK